MNSSSANRFFVETVEAGSDTGNNAQDAAQSRQDNVSVLPAMQTSPAAPAGRQVTTLRESAERAIAHYLNELDGAPAHDVYDMVIAEVELPLLKKILEYTRGNQSKAAEVLGINRGTLRKKLKQHKLL